VSSDDVDSIFFKYNLNKAEPAWLIVVCKRTLTPYNFTQQRDDFTQQGESANAQWTNTQSDWLIVAQLEITNCGSIIHATIYPIPIL
jgi:hypothetical protein